MSMVAKVTVSLPEELLARLDAEAEALGVSRSLLVQEATASYLGETAEDRTATRRRVGVRQAIEGMREMAARNPRLDGRGSIEVLRDVRSLGEPK
jgi:metal-responsive CopG/Arc/MetJ family transcriptional regulator